ncbi:MAG: hypothetical protein KDA24_00360 [Deltaproteobacteria bacterium]|nr:hypothetical protein [Deltaproteobacteria bacterium]
MLSDDARVRLIDHLPDGLLLVRQEVVVFASVRASEIMGISPRRIQGEPIHVLGDDAVHVVQRVLAGSAVCTARDLPWSRPGGTRRITFVGSPGEHAGEVLLVVREAIAQSDPTERDSFRRRLLWLDGLAAGMAHEVRNPLGGIRGAAQLLRRSPDPADVDELTGLIIRETDRINAIVEQLMLFSRPRALRRDAVQLNRLLHDEVALLRAQSAGPGAESGPEGAPTIDVVLDLDPSLPPVEGDPDRLREAVGNLLRNAWEAARARVHVSTRVDPESRVREGGLDRGLGIRVSVGDDGEGIDPERLPQLFAPFATTKTDGSGLGLFVTRLAVDAHAGKLDVQPGPGQGARFDLTLWERLPDDVPTVTSTDSPLVERPL